LENQALFGIFLDATLGEGGRDMEGSSEGPVPLVPKNPTPREKIMNGGEDKTFTGAILRCYQQCLRALGGKVEENVGVHKVTAYGVGQNLLRIDIKFAIPRAWPIDPDPDPKELPF
jgi:hypothetical protein